MSFQTDLTRLPGTLPIWHGVTDAAAWQAAASAVAQAGGRLLEKLVVIQDGFDL